MEPQAPHAEDNTTPAAQPGPPAPIQPLAPAAPLQTAAAESLPPSTQDTTLALQPMPGKNKKLVLGAVAGVVALTIVSAAVYLLLPKNTTGAKLLVDKNPYLYACSATTPDTLAKTLGYNTNRNNQSATVNFQFAPDNTKDKQVDLLSLTGAQSTDNNCELFVADSTATKANPSPASRDVYVSIDQYPNAQDAMSAFDNNKQQGDQPLPAFPSSSFYTQPATNQSDPMHVSISAFIVYKSSMLGYVLIVPQGSQSAQYVDDFTTLAKAAMANIDNGNAAKVTTFQRYTSLNSNPYVDACTAVNYAKLGKLVAGGIQLDPNNVNSNQVYGKDASYSDPQALTSICTFSFRTTAEQQAEAKLPPAQSTQQNSTSSSTAAYDTNFSHSLSIGVTAVASAADIQKAEAQYTKEQGSKLSQVKINGQNSYKSTSTEKDDSGNPLDVYQYFVSKGSYLYTLQIVLRRQTKPYPTTNYTLNDADAAKLFKVIMQMQAK